MYEERAVDVAIDNRLPDLSKRHKQCLSSLPKIVNITNKSGNDDKLIKIKRPQSGGTVRSIPIKDYQASIAYNIGTLRRSMAPQSQFESLVSEPEKSVYMPSRKRVPLTNSSHHRSMPQITACVAAQTAEEVSGIQKKSCCCCYNQHDSHNFYCADSNTCVKDTRYFNKTENRRSQEDDGSDMDEYFRRSTRGRFSSSDYRVSRRARETSGNMVTVTTTGTRNNEKVEEEARKLQLAEGNVGQKVSAYEQNSRRSLRDPSPEHRSLLEIRGHRTIGVPLVGMHNACGLPVVASWHDQHDLLDSLRISRGIAGTAGLICRGPRTIPNVRRRMQPKRKAPQPDRAVIHSRDVNYGIKRSTVKLAEYLDVVNGSGRSRKRHRRSSFTMTKMGSLSSKNSFKKTPKRYGIKASSLVDTLGRKSIKGGNAKRTTLYAKDDGKEPVQVLKGLCLNPLARANPETDMMW